MLSHIILQYYKSYSLISPLLSWEKKIKFLETVKLTERTMFFQNYLCLKSSYNLVQMASTSSPQLTPVPFVPTTSLYSPIFLSTNNSRPVSLRSISLKTNRRIYLYNQVKTSPLHPPVWSKGYATFQHIGRAVMMHTMNDLTLHLRPHPPQIESGTTLTYNHHITTVGTNSNKKIALSHLSTNWMVLFLIWSYIKYNNNVSKWRLGQTLQSPLP